ncbi:hypothetical protein J25TS5_55840 [Paenibacillus faecis]|uniref:hypothetical protein n=1 Tax=Paenibacillus faecis TaxID=862114 RepID=UPI001B00993F|nr:hypothetical protein [Paenibacillus faecis]GIO88652.1 hypothetical protein J25TS5_55840 [Paenibacillus faecis]
MDFEQRLSAFIGRSIEVIFTNQFLQGQILNVSDGTLTIQAESSNYIPEPRQVTVVSNNVIYVRIPQ